MVAVPIKLLQSYNYEKQTRCHRIKWILIPGHEYSDSNDNDNAEGPSVNIPISDANILPTDSLVTGAESTVEAERHVGNFVNFAPHN